VILKNKQKKALIQYSFAMRPGPQAFFVYPDNTRGYEVFYLFDAKKVLAYYSFMVSWLTNLVHSLNEYAS